MPASPRPCAFRIALALACLFALTSCAAQAAPGAPRNLQCEYQAHPLAIDTFAPRLSWQVTDDRRGAVQSAYQLQVASSAALLQRGAADVWDSGKTASPWNIQVPYAGPELQSTTAYAWRVRTWDAADQPSPWSEVAGWETGFLRPSDWQARWIATAPPSAIAAAGEWREGDWIWAPASSGNGARAFLRKTLDVPAGATIRAATVHWAADNYAVLYVNGQRLGACTDWGQSSELDVAAALQPGPNTLAIAAQNQDGPCGVRFALRLDLGGPEPVWLRSDTTWAASATEAPGWSEPAFDDSAWPRAEFMAAFGGGPWTTGQASAVRSMLARKEFAVTAPVTRARVYVCGLGAYALHLNGRQVSRDVMPPDWTLFSAHTQYQAFDVTSELKQGANAIGVVLGSGWWKSRIAGESSQPDRDTCRLLLQMHITYADGTETRLVSDPSWQVHPSPVTASDIYDGESCDGRLEVPGWDLPGLDATGWTVAEPLDLPLDNLVAQSKEPIEVLDDLPTVKLTEPQPGVFIFDFGQNLTGWVRLNVSGPAGTVITLRHGEVLNPDGTLYTENLRSARATDTYTLRGEGVETWEPRFTYHGFRYVEVTGFPGTPSPDTLLARAATSATPFDGSFSCSNDLVNRIQHAILWGQRGNMWAVPTDCPQRDERLGWMGDTQMFANTSCWNANMARFYAKWMRDIRDCQGPDGEVRDVNPIPGGWGAAAPAWGDACIIVPWQVYSHYGDLSIINDNWDCMIRWLDYMTRNRRDGLYLRGGYGDWIAVTGSPAEPISAAYYYYDCVLLERMARATGRDAEASKYAALATETREAFNRRFLNPETNQYPGGTQTANLLPLFFGMVPEDRVEAVAANVAADVRRRGNHLSTGFLGTGYINPVLSQVGRHDLAWRLATQRTYPSWGYMIRKDATTIWELWNSDTAGPGMNSRNHFCLGTVGEWFYEYLAGIQIAEPGLRRVRFSPGPVADLTSARASVTSPYGPVSADWSLTNGDLHLRVALPANTSGTVELPTFGRTGITFLEGERELARDGLAVGQAEGVRFLGLQGDRAVFEIGAGSYDFTARGLGAPPVPEGAQTAPAPAIRELTDDFSAAAPDPARWSVLSLGLESEAPSALKATLQDGALRIAGSTDVNYWTGRTLQSRGAFTIAPGERLEVSVRRLYLRPTGSGTRTGLWLWVDPSSYVLFSQDTEKAHWSFNADGGQGSGEELLKDATLGEHVMGMVHDGEAVSLLLDGKELARIPVGWNEAIHVMLSGQARAAGDALDCAFDDLTARLTPAP